MNENAIKNFSLSRARGFFACALALALMAAVLVPLAVFGAGGPEAPAAEPKAEAKADPKASLKSRDREVRQRAVRDMEKAKPEGAYEALEGALEDEDALVRGGAAKALAETGDPRAAEKLLAVVRSTEPADLHVRWGAIEALGRLGDKRAVGPLIRLLDDADKNTRWKAVLALGQLGAARAVRGLAKVPESDEDLNVRHSAVEAIGLLGGAEAEAALRKAAGGKDKRARGAAEHFLKKRQGGAKK
ncbi:MAG: HEAT repeat domain-containing protein [Elusimicrobia bacterium]|nr:HEAT repeat domain-containing protein [Elusimicrobiota bacterium]